MALHIVGPGFSTLVRSVRLYCLEKGLDPSYGMTAHGRPLALGSEAHRALHPFAHVPVLLHGERRIFETVPICRYLDEAFPAGDSQAADQDSRHLIDEWASALASTVDNRLVRRYLLSVAGPRPDKTLSAEALADLEAGVQGTLEVLQRQLGEQPFLCGTRLSMADALLAPMLDYLDRVPRQAWLASFPRLADYLQHLRERPAGRSVLVAPDFSVF